MKISSFYMSDISEYDNFKEKIINDIDCRFNNIGSNPLAISQFISYLRKEFNKYIKIRFGKDVSIIISLPKDDFNVIDKIYSNKRENIKIRLCYDKVIGILNGEYINYDDFISSIIEEVNSILTSEPTHQFNDYLIIQMDKLSEICFTELSSVYSKDFLKHNIKNPKAWIKLERQSSIFKDYYTYFKENKSENKNNFIRFLLKLYNFTL